MHRTRRQTTAAETRIEVEGELDAVGGYDLHRAFAQALAEGARHVVFDLSRVTALDEDGIHALETCSAEAVQAGAVLIWMGSSTPLVTTLRSETRARRIARAQAAEPLDTRAG